MMFRKEWERLLAAAQQASFETSWLLKRIEFDEIRYVFTIEFISYSGNIRGHQLSARFVQEVTPETISDMLIRQIKNGQ